MNRKEECWYVQNWQTKSKISAVIPKPKQIIFVMFDTKPKFITVKIS